MLRVVVVGDRDGFTLGTAAGNYVRLVEQGMAAAGADVSQVPDWDEVSRGRVAHLLDIRRVVRGVRPDALVYYGHSLLVIAWCFAVTRRRPTAFVLHAVEWPPANPATAWRARLRAGSFGRWAFALTDAAIVISRDLVDKVDAVARRRRRTIPSFRLPILVDADVVMPAAAASDRRYAVYCGDLVGYRDDVHTVIDALGVVGDPDLELVLVGRAPAVVVEELRARASRSGLHGRLDVVTDVLPYDSLLALYAGATLLLAPLPDDERTRARYPSKLADYLLSGRPVVTSNVGEVVDLLTDGVDGYVGEPGSVASFAAAVRHALDDARRDDVGAAGRRRALDALDHRRRGAELVTFLARVAERRCAGGSRSR